ncbi:MAG: lipopolysaccharide biosynthesis protein [Planctomycetaceae bacterium]
MAENLSSPNRRLLDGLFWVLLSESLFPLTAVIAAGVLTRELSTYQYGQFTLVVTLVSWVETCLLALFARATILFVRRARDWKAVGSTVVRYQFGAGLLATAALVLAADGIADLLKAPGLSGPLRLMALDIPLYSVSQAYRQVLIGRGCYRGRAVSGAVRWLTRAILIITLVKLGWGVTGALVGLIATSCVDLAVGRRLTRLPLWGRSDLRIRDLVGYAVPLFIFAVSQHTFERLDLFMLKSLGATVTQAGQYGAAQNLALLPVWFGQVLIALVLSAVTQLIAEGDRTGARQLSRQALRGCLLLLPVAGLVAGGAPGVMTVVYGSEYAIAAPVLAVLVFAAIGLVLISTTAALLTALNHPAWCLAIGVPMVPVACVGQALIIPRFGATGAGLTTAIVAGLFSIISLLMLRRLENVAAPTGTLFRSVALAIGAFIAVGCFPAPRGWVLIQLSATAGIVVLILLLLGEFRGQNISVSRFSFFSSTPPIDGAREPT